MPKMSKRVRRTARTPVYTVGAASRLTGIPIYTIRWIEKHGLIETERTLGNQRLFSDEDVELLNQIRELMEERVNLHGIRIILRMRVQRTFLIKH